MDTLKFNQTKCTREYNNEQGKTQINKISNILNTSYATPNTIALF